MDIFTLKIQPPPKVGYVPSPNSPCYTPKWIGSNLLGLETYVRFFPNLFMVTSSDHRLKQAVLWYASCPTMKLSDVMRAAKFTEEEIRSRKWQMKVRRHPKYKKKAHKVMPNTPLNDNDSSPLTNSNNTVNPSTPKRTLSTKSSKKQLGYEPQKKKKIWRLGHQVMTEMEQQKLQKAKESEAHKKATLMYSHEKEKKRSDPTRKSAQTVTDNKHKRYGWNVSNW